MSKRKINPSSRPWSRIRAAVFERDGYRCRKCGKAGRLEAHHKTELADGGTNEVDNVETLCRSCHINHHRGAIADEQSPWDELVKGLV